MSEDTKYRNSVAVKVMEVLLAEGLPEKMAHGTIEQSMDNAQTFVDALTMVTAKIIVSHLMKQMSVGQDPLVVVQNARAIVDTVYQNLDLSVDYELGQSIKKLKELVVMEELNPKNTTSH